MRLRQGIGNARGRPTNPGIQCESQIGKGAGPGSLGGSREGWGWIEADILREEREESQFMGVPGEKGRGRDRDPDRHR